jgi:hypothetical protein
MFNSKKTQLFETKSNKTSATNNPFVIGAMKKSAETLSGNGAKKYSTTGDAFVDQFGKLGSYKSPRDFAEISKDCETLWGINKLYTILLIFYIRTITRVVTLFSGISTKTAQKGAELKHEGIMRMLWLHFKAPEVFWKNIGLFISIGSWKDVFTMLRYDLTYHNWNDRKLDWEKFGNLILAGLNNKNTVNLVKKYLPQIKSTNKCKTIDAQANTMIAKWICSLLFGSKESSNNYKQYRNLKTSGTAHEWQQLISQGKHDLVDFGKIHGRALNLLVRSKYLFNQGLSDKYAAWVEKPETKVKYTGFVHELFQDYTSDKIMRRRWNDRTPRMTLISVAKHIQDTINKQFNTLVQKAKSENNHTNLIVVRDTSGSMGSIATGTNMPCYDVAKALALYFSEFLTGIFSNNWIEFNSKATMHSWNGNTPMEKWFNDTSGFVGSTNFQSVIDLFVELKNKGIPEQHFPSGILCISDSEFNPASLEETNVEAAKRKLRQAGFSNEYVNNFIIILWNLQSSYYGRGTGEKFETYNNVPNIFYFSGYSAATISFLSEKIKTPKELFESAMNQEILNMIEL